MQICIFCPLGAFDHICKHTLQQHRHTPHSSPVFQSVLHFDPVFFFSPACDGTTREDCCPLYIPSWLHTDTSAAALPLCVRCLLITSATIVSRGVGGASIHRAIFCHEAKVLYSSSNGGLNSPDSCIHCLVTLCAAGFVPPHFMQAPITSGFLFLHSVDKSSTIFFFFSFSPLCYFYSSQQ